MLKNFTVKNTKSIVLKIQKNIVLKNTKKFALKILVLNNSNKYVLKNNPLASETFHPK